MKTRLIVFALSLLVFASCGTSQSTTRRATSDDDIYYSRRQSTPSNSPTQDNTPTINPEPTQVPPPPAPVRNNNQGNSRFYYDNSPKQGQYQDSLSIRKDSIHYQANSKFNNRVDSGAYEDYDNDYAARINRFYYPYGAFGYYDPYFYPYSYYGYSPFYYGLGWGWNFGLGFGFGLGWGYPYYPGYFGSFYHGWYGYDWYGHGGGYYGGVNGGFIPGGNTYAPRRTITGANTFANANFNRGNTLGLTNPINNPINRSSFNNVNRVSSSNPLLSRGNFNAPNRNSINNTNTGRLSGAITGSRINSFSKPAFRNGNFNYSTSAASRPLASQSNQTYSGVRSSYFNSNQRFGGFGVNNNINRSYSAPAYHNNSVSRPSFSAPARSSFGGGVSRGFSGGGFRGGRR